MDKKNLADLTTSGNIDGVVEFTDEDESEVL